MVQEVIKPQSGGGEPAQQEISRYSAGANWLYRGGLIGVVAGAITFFGGAIGYDIFYNREPQSPDLTARIEVIKEQVSAIENRPLTFREYTDAAFRDTLTARVHGLKEERARIEASEELAREKKDYSDRMGEYRAKGRKSMQASLSGLVLIFLSCLSNYIGNGMRKKEDMSIKGTGGGRGKR